MDPIERMVAEHRVIEPVLDALAVLAAAIGAAGADRDEASDRRSLGDWVTFLRGYADALHHGKEESILFASLQRRSVPPALGPPLAAICRDHETARLLTGDLASLQRRQPWTAVDRTRIHRTVVDYTSLLRRHIAAEDTAIFPAVAAALGRRGMAAVAKACERFEREHGQECVELERLAARLSAAQSPA
jgi:hemerythrin-like domain-containing protein